MTLISMASVSGAAGVSVTALGVAAALPTADTRTKVLVEADPFGGSLALDYQLGRQPGLVTLAAASRHGLTPAEFWSHAQELPGGLPVVVSPERGDRVSSILDANGADVGAWLSASDIVCIADCGRLLPLAPTSGLVGAADLAVVVARPCAKQIHAGAPLVEAMTSLGVRTVWVLIGSGPHTADEVERVTGQRVLRTLDEDRRGADALSAGEVGGRAGRRPLLRQIAALAKDLDALARPQQTQAEQSAELTPLFAGVAR